MRPLAAYTSSDAAESALVHLIHAGQESASVSLTALEIDPPKEGDTLF